MRGTIRRGIVPRYARAPKSVIHLKVSQESPDQGKPGPRRTQAAGLPTGRYRRNGALATVTNERGRRARLLGAYPATALTPTIATTTSVKTATQIEHSNMARLPV